MRWCTKLIITVINDDREWQSFHRYNWKGWPVRLLQCPVWVYQWLVCCCEKFTGCTNMCDQINILSYVKNAVSCIYWSIVHISLIIFCQKINNYFQRIRKYAYVKRKTLGFGVKILKISCTNIGIYSIDSENSE